MKTIRGYVFGCLLMALEPFSGATAFMGKERAVYSFMALEPFAEATVFEGTEEAVYLFTALEPAMALEPFSGATAIIETASRRGHCDPTRYSGGCDSK